MLRKEQFMKKNKKNLDVDELYCRKLEEENKNLRKENAKLRKELAIVNFIQASEDKLEYLELKRVEKEEEQERIELRQKWLCDSCGRGSLHIHVFELPNNKKKYYRACPHCNKRTPMKDFHNKVYGLFAPKKEK